MHALLRLLRVRLEEKDGQVVALLHHPLSGVIRLANDAVPLLGLEVLGGTQELVDPLGCFPNLGGHLQSLREVLTRAPGQAIKEAVNPLPDSLEKARDEQQRIDRWLEDKSKQ
jgi:hypothetical protein